MSIRLTRTRLIVAIAAVVALVPATALATDVFDDVEDTQFYAAATKWVQDNNITTGSPGGSKTFKPDDPATRGESVTFLNRYDTNVVQPAFADHLGKFADHLGEFADHLGESDAHAGRMEFDDHLGESDAHAGRMEFDDHLGESDAHAGRMEFDDHLGKSDAHAGRMEFDDHLGKFADHLGEFADHLGEFAARLGESDARLGRMEFQDIDLALTRGDTVEVGTVDGVTIKVTCVDVNPGSEVVDIRVFAESDADGWYMPEHSQTVLMMTDVGEFIRLGDVSYQSSTESAWVNSYAHVQTIRTPNGGYIGIDLFDTVVIIHPTVTDDDCLYMGVYKYFDPPT